MKTSALSLKIDPKIKSEAQKIANSLGFSLSAVINASLVNLIRSKTISYSMLSPTPLLKQAINSARKDRACGKSTKSFHSSEEMMKSLLS
jgi:addiction module RelB/DinJ family antitoxin